MGNRMSSSLIDRTTSSTPVDTIKPVLKKGGFCCVKQKKAKYLGILALMGKLGCSGVHGWADDIWQIPGSIERVNPGFCVNSKIA